MRDLEIEVGCSLMTRSSRGIELTAAGRVFLDHARVVLRQVDAAVEAARRAAEPARTEFVLGFLTGHEFGWLQSVMAILRAEIPAAEVTVLSRSSPDLASGLMRGKIDLALMRSEPNLAGVHVETLIAEPLIVLMPADHRLTAHVAIRPRDLSSERLIGVPAAKSPILRRVTDAYSKAAELELVPQYEVDNLSMVISLIVSTGGVALMPDYARNLLPPSVVSRPLAGEPPTIDLVIGYRSDNPMPKLAEIVAQVKRVRPSRSGLL